MKLESSAFDDGAEIPVQYTCEGDDVSPPLSWSGVPRDARTLALIVDDPDAPDPAAPQTTFVHWVVHGLEPTVGELEEAVHGAGQPGLNDWDRTGYGGPCPPIGRHRYFFKLYALDTEPSFVKTPTKADLEAAMEGHVVAEAVLMGTYEKRGE